METANVERTNKTDFNKNDETETDVQLPLSVDCSEKSYEQCSPPVCYVDLLGHKSAKEQQGSSLQGFGDSVLKLPPCDVITPTSNSGSASGTPSVTSPENSSLIVKDVDNGECVSLILTPPESIVPSSVVQDQKNTTTTSIPGPLVDGHLDDVSEGRLMIVDVEKESLEMDEDEDEDRPLVLDLGDSGNTPSPTQSASPVVIISEETPSVFRKPSIPPSKSSSRETPPPLKTPLSSTAKVSVTKPIISVTPSFLHARPPSPRVQKPIRPFIPSHFNPPEVSHNYTSASATVSLASPSTPHFLTSTSSLTGTSTTFRLQTPQLPLPTPPLPPPLPLPPPPPLSHSNSQPSCPPPTLSGPQATNNVQFMSVLTPSPSVASGVQHSPIQLFNLAPMHGYINSGPGLLFQSISSGGGGGASGNQPASPGTFHFAPPPPPPHPPPPLFAPQQHFQPVPPHQHQNFASRSPLSFSSSLSCNPSAAVVTSMGGGGGGVLPPPPPLAPAPGLSAASMQHATGTRTPLAGLFIPDMNSWMASVTGAQVIPPLQPIFSCQPASISSGEVIYSSVLTPSATTTATAFTPITTTATTTSLPSNQPSVLPPPHPPPPHPPPPPSSPVSKSPIRISENTPPPVAINGSPIDATKALTSSTVTPSSSSKFSISARRWRPSSGKKSSTHLPPSEPLASKEVPVADRVFSTATSSASVNEKTTPGTTSITTEECKNEDKSLSQMEAIPLSKIEAETLKVDGQAMEKEESSKGGKTSVETSTPGTVPQSASTTKPPPILKNKVAHHAPKKAPSRPPPPPPALHSMASAPAVALPTTTATTTTTTTTTTTHPSVVPQRKIISHYIDGHVLYESNLPFPVRNAMSVVRSTLQKCNGFNKSQSAITTTTVPTGPVSELVAVSTDEESVHEKSKRPSDIILNGDSLDVPTQRQKDHSSGSVSRKRRRPDPEMSRVDEGIEVDKKKRKKSPVVVPSSFSISQPTPSQNGHNENSRSRETKSPKESDCKSAAVLPASISVPTSSAPASSVGSSLKMTIHPVYQSSSGIGGGKTTSKPVSQAPGAKISFSSSQSVSISSSVPSTALPVCQASLAVFHQTVRQTSQPTQQSTPTPARSQTPQTSGLMPPPLPQGPVSKWSPRAVAEFVRSTSGCAAYAEAFETNEVDGEALLLLSASDFIAPPIAMKIGHALKLAHRVKNLASSSNPHGISSDTAPT
ncbi:hypothetical protein Aperf_G00000019357 [Anoplocephala perfoliata]